MPNIYAIPNHSSSSTFQVIPWEYEPTSKPGKDQWKNPSLDHCFYSGFHGASPSTRLGKMNPPILCSALIADYDSPAVEKDLVETLQKRSTSILPAWVGRTTSGGIRCVWLLEKELPVHPGIAKAFLKYVSKKIGAEKLFAGLDRGAFYDPYKYYEVGHDWQQVSAKVIDHDIAAMWLVESSAGHDWKREETVVPMDRVADRVEALFPGKWTTTFEEGARGPRFWDSSADNQTSSVVRATGMQCFTGMQAFVPWKQILGAEWVQKFEAERIGGSVGNIWYDGQHYHIQGKSGDWRACNRADTMSHLKVNQGLSGRTDKQGTSEAETAIVRIQESQSVEGAVKLPCKPVGLIHTADGRYLNTCDRQVCTPSELPVTGSDEFPFLYLLLEHLTDFREEQLYPFVAWIQRFFITGYNMDLQPGQTLFLCGPTEIGKTLFSTLVLSKLVGGHMDASDYLTGATDWNSELIQRPLWTVDDAAALRDRQTYARWNSQIKKMSANRTFTVQEKYRKSTTVNWAGRIVVTLNTDPESKRMLPDLDISNSDKVMIINCGTKPVEFPEDIAGTIASELPAFARFLLDWIPPAGVVNQGRYGVHAFIDEELKLDAHMGASSHSFLELLRAFVVDMDLDEPLVGSSTQILGQLLSDSSIVQNVARGYNNRSVGREMGKLIATYPHLISFRHLGNSREWIIDPKIKNDYEQK